MSKKNGKNGHEIYTHQEIINQSMCVETMTANLCQSCPSLAFCNHAITFDYQQEEKRFEDRVRDMLGKVK